MIAMVNGVVSENPAIPVNDRGFTLGDALFETIPLYDGKPFLLERHLARLRDSARIIRLTIPFTNDEITGAIKTLVERGRIPRGVARLTVSRGAGPRGYGIAGCVSPSWVLTVEPYEPMSRDGWKRGLSLATSQIRKNEFSVLSGIKSTSALERIMILEEAKKTGADEALALSTQGYAASGAAVNIFWARYGRLHTSSLDCGILPGVTRGMTLELARKEGIETVEGRFRPQELIEADEVFVTNSLMEIVPVSRIDGGAVSKTPGPLALRLSELYSGAIAAF